MDCLSLLLFLLVQAAKPAPVPGIPAPAGIYYRQADGKWIKLEPPLMADMKTKGMGLFIETAGLSGLGMTAVYRGAHAPVQISDPRPTFYIRGTGSEKDTMIVQLTQKKDSRTLRTSTSSATVDNKGGFSRGEIRKVTCTVYSDGSFSVQPEEDLKSGEYLLVFGYATAGFDFGILASRQ